jgi:hypothetical protein
MNKGFIEGFVSENPGLYGIQADLSQIKLLFFEDFSYAKSIVFCKKRL